jgi:hypothetical protein
MNDNNTTPTTEAERCTECGQLFPATNPADSSALKREHNCETNTGDSENENPYRFEPKTGLPAVK